MRCIARCADRIRSPVAAGRRRVATTFVRSGRFSELGRWLDWVDRYVEDNDVLRTFRNRVPALMLYHCVSNWEADRIVKAGFTDAAASCAQADERPASVAFTDVPMRGAYGGTTRIVIEVSEDAVLPYELPAKRGRLSPIRGAGGCHESIRETSPRDRLSLQALT